MSVKFRTPGHRVASPSRARCWWLATCACPALVTMLPASAAPAAANSNPSANTVLMRAFAAMGGHELLSGLHTLRLELRSVSYRIDDSERAEGPYWLNISLGTEWVDLDAQRSRTEWDQASAQWPLRIVQIERGSVEDAGANWHGKWQWSGAPAPAYRDVALQPERILLTAAGAADLHTLADQPLHDQLCHVLAFTHEGHEVRLYVDTVSYLPTRLEIEGRSDTPLATMLGDIEWREDYLFYKRTPDGLVMPYQQNVYRNGQSYQTTVVTALQENAPVPTGAFASRVNAKAQRAVAWGGEPIDPKSMEALDNGVWMIKGGWNVLVVRQPDGLLVIEAPESSAYSAHVLALLAQRFPGVPVKALISTTDSLWHIAGVRTYVARGIPIYALDTNVWRLKAEIATSRNKEPDELARHSVAPHVLPVTGPTRIGVGRTRVEVFPIRGHGDERMMMVYLPGLHLLYGSSNDIVLQQLSKPRATFNAFELVRRVEALRLPVERYVGIHTDSIAWTAVRESVLTRPALSSG